MSFFKEQIINDVYVRQPVNDLLKVLVKLHIISWKTDDEAWQLLGTYF